MKLGRYKKMVVRIMLFIACVSVCSMVAPVFSSCSEEIELCNLKKHPHAAYFDVKHDWSGIKSTAIPDSMLVFAERLVQRWDCGYMVSTKTNQGKIIYEVDTEDEDQIENPGNDDENAGENPGNDDADAGENPGNDDSDAGENPGNGDSDAGENPGNGDSDAGENPGNGDENSGETPDQPSTRQTQSNNAVLPHATVRVRPGEYEVMSFSRNVEEFNYKGLDTYVDDRSDSTNMDSIYVEYKAYDKSDPRLKRYISSWTDFNPYAKYVQSGAHPFYYAIMGPLDCPLDTHVPLTMKPRSYMQNITFRFSVEKQMDKDSQFIIDSMHVEISGVPHRIYLMNGNIDVKKTYKMLLPPIYMNSKDSYTTQRLQCETFFTSPGIVPPVSDDTALGPGIAVVKVFLHTEQHPESVYMVNARINLFRTISASPMIKMNEEMTAGVLRGDYHVINVSDVLRLNAKEIIRSTEDLGNDADRWEPCGKGSIVDI